MKYSRWWLLSVFIFLVGCSADINKLFKDRSEVIQTQKIFQAMTREDLSYVRAALSDEANQATNDETLSNLMKQVPKTAPQSENSLGWHYTETKSVVTGLKQRKSDAIIEYYYGDNQWILVQAQYIGDENQLKAQVFNLQFNDKSSDPNSIPWYSMAEFTYGNLLALIVAVVSLLFSIYVAIKCYKTPDLKHKWWWIAFSVFGFMYLSMSSQGVATNVSFNVSSLIFLSPLRVWAAGIIFPLGAVWTNLHLRKIARQPPQ